MPKFGLIGHPISTSLSPGLFTKAYKGKYLYELIETPDFEEAWARFLAEYQAINVTAPFKVNAYYRADWCSPEVERCGATNLCVKTPEGVKAYNSDYRGVREILKTIKGTAGPAMSAAVIGFGGAGKAALAAAEDEGFGTKLYRHSEIAGGVSADVIIYTLPSAVEGIDKLECSKLIEANYKTPCLSSHPGYISGREWLRQQAITGYELMTGEVPEVPE